MSTEQKILELKKKMDEVFFMSYDITEDLARKILKDNPQLDEFIMCMGSFFFTDKKGNDIDTFNSVVSKRLEKSFQPLNDFICDWDNTLKITSEPMRFTANGPKITDW